ncbi:hypothetical protein [Ochrobactrum sp. BTU2]|uniref:hypothetical protein n=1 Tax=Ochrobactrum sp. BTU2 TaxID=2856166 RepID=UPI002119E998|nr:hypothetical protein [Ochrobactrum sp. BTU2]MCQ9143314.1 hypothetical protein [Ochrobactrum sp. BTU2]
MISGKIAKFIIIDEVGEVHPPRWRRLTCRFGCDRSRRILDRFPKKADAIARATVEGGSRLCAGKAVRHG